MLAQIPFCCVKQLKKLVQGYTSVRAKLVEWTGYEAYQTTKKITMLLCLRLSARSRLCSSVPGVMAR